MDDEEFHRLIRRAVAIARSEAGSRMSMSARDRDIALCDQIEAEIHRRWCNSLIANLSPDAKAWMSERRLIEQPPPPQRAKSKGRR